ncbi:MAG: RHS repeat-associated core domain-containing protein, partial [Bryobacteraceae bacterium]|nr:RHS repeat-associated core domain-containing protein [Bryobacteraceae bacterium]
MVLFDVFMELEDIPGVVSSRYWTKLINDSAGRPFQFTSYDAATGGSVVNQVERHYNGLGQLTEEFQEHSGAVNTGTSPSVKYVFSEMVSGANHSRLVRTVYPNGRIVRSEYGTPGGLNDHISRLEYLADDASGSIGTHLEELSYLGLDTVVRRAHPEPDVDLTYIKLTGEPDGDAGDQYAGLDRFGRVIDQRWIDTGTLAETDRFGYGHDRNGDRLYRENLVDAAFSELYHADGSAGGYDLLNRLTDFQRGTLNAGNDTIATASREQVWDLDALGNWDSLASDGGTAQTRTHNAQNQVTGVNGQTSPTFDNNGNTTTDETGKKFKFDAWNRLRDVRDASNNLLETVTHDALNRRIELAPQSGTVRALYYSAEWQVVEERESGVAVVQNVWSPVYVDALILRDRDTDGNGSLEERMYVQQDANFNVTAIITTAGVVQERYLYDPYGKASYLNADFTSRASSNFGWLYLHQGGRLDLTSSLYNFRNRDFSATLGRWLQQDPLGYVDGVNLYQYVLSRPINATDPTGLTPCWCGETAYVVDHCLFKCG